jgi:acyl-CoA synthetase (NDP forming)
MTCEKRVCNEVSDFERIFHPENIAIVGVSPRGSMFGSGILNSISAIGFEGGIYPVNPKGGEYNGGKIYTSLSEIPVSIDFAVIAVPAEAVPAALEECRNNGVAGVEILSAGFSESGTQRGSELEEEIKKISAQGIRVVGPNCFGIYCPASGLTLLPGPDLSRESGPVAFVSQSGGMAIDFAHIGKWMGIRFSKVISFGNGADLRETELLEYLGSDPETKVIAMYIEGVDRGREFFEVLKDVAARKPVIINKGGLTEAGSRAVASHTASMGGSRIIWESVIRQAGAIQVDDLWELAYTSLAFSLLPQRIYKGITVAGGGGALGVGACDAAERFGQELPLMKRDIHDAIMAVLPKPGSSANNPIDAANPFVSPQAYQKVFLNAAKDPRVDVQILIQLLHHYKSLSSGMGLEVRDIVPYNELAEVAGTVAADTDKPIMLVLPDFKQGIDSLDIEEVIREARDAFLKKGIPVFGDLDNALGALRHVSQYYSRKNMRGNY